ncbi:MAG: 50S ribosomal protein L15 [Chlamydiota bacterium]
MITLSTLGNTHRPTKKARRVGRGVGSKRGKTCGRGAKGDKARSGYKHHFGREGGQLPLYRKLPCRGFGNERFRNEVYAINLGKIDEHFNDGDVVNYQSLKDKKLAPRQATNAVKILSGGELTKKVTIEAHAFSQCAKEKLEKLSIPFKIVTK